MGFSKSASQSWPLQQARAGEFRLHAKRTMQEPAIRGLFAPVLLRTAPIFSTAPPFDTQEHRMGFSKSASQSWPLQQARAGEFRLHAKRTLQEPPIRGLFAPVLLRIAPIFSTAPPPMGGGRVDSGLSLLLLLLSLSHPLSVSFSLSLRSVTVPSLSHTHTLSLSLSHTQIRDHPSLSLFLSLSPSLFHTYTHTHTHTHTGP